MFEISNVKVNNSVGQLDDGETPALPVVVATILELKQRGSLPFPAKGTGQLYGNFQRVGDLVLPPPAKIAPQHLAGPLALAGANTPIDEIAGAFPLLDKRDTGATAEGRISVDEMGRGIFGGRHPAGRGGSHVHANPGIRQHHRHQPRRKAFPARCWAALRRSARSRLSSCNANRLPICRRSRLASGYDSTLQVRVNGLLWQEVDSFFGAAPSDQVYIVRHDEAGETYITFGDGVYGAYPPAGSNNIMAGYRTGAGSAMPPAMTIRQAVNPLKGLSQVFNPLGAAGGADADSPDAIRKRASASTLTFGRAYRLTISSRWPSAIPGSSTQPRAGPGMTACSAPPSQSGISPMAAIPPPTCAPG